MDDKRQFLKTIDFLEGVSAETLAEICDQVVEISMPRDEVIFSDESPGDAMYFIVEGEVHLQKKGHLLLSRGQGEYVGEMALVDDEGRSASAVCASDVRLLRWQRNDFLKTLVANGRVAYQVCRAFSAKIRQSVESATRFKQDLEHAVRLQKAMLPQGDFSNALIELAAYCAQAEDIGGDFYDYLTFEDDQVALVVADAQGHGYSAALLVAMLKARLYSQVRRDRAPEQIMKALNETLFKSINEVQMATSCYILVDGKEEKFYYCSAGHVPQFHYRADLGKVDMLESTSLILGFDELKDVDYRVETRSWHPGDFLILCTDGVMEAKNELGEEFGAGRLAETIQGARFTEPREVQRRLLAELERFRGGSTFTDDVTLVAVRLRSRREMVVADGG